MNRSNQICAWLGVVALGYVANVSALEWYPNCFTPNMATLLKQGAFPEIADLEAIGSGSIERISPTATSDRRTSLQIPVMAHRQSPASRDVVFLLDTESGCLSKLRLSSRIPERKGLAFDLEHETDGNCRTRSVLSKASIVETYKCDESNCHEESSYILLFLGPVEHDGVTVLDQPLFGGEFSVRELSRRFAR